MTSGLYSQEKGKQYEQIKTLWNRADSIIYSAGMLITDVYYDEGSKEEDGTVHLSINSQKADNNTLFVYILEFDEDDCNEYRLYE